LIRVALIASTVFVLTTGCGKKSVGEDCTAGATDCADGTSCIIYGARSIVDGGLSCDASKLLCSTPCSSDAECVTKLGAGHICKKDCAQGSCLKGN
jgi:hypothetical protein